MFRGFNTNADNALSELTWNKGHIYFSAKTLLFIILHSLTLINTLISLTKAIFRTEYANVIIKYTFLCAFL